MRLLALLLSSSSSLAGSAYAVSPVVRLDYATYSGEALDNGITKWLGLRYAAPPIGELRFRAPQDPLPQNGTISATEARKTCLFTGKTESDPPDDDHDEDCLFLSVYAPSNATVDSRLPVFFWMQGGGFNKLSALDYDGSGIIQAAEYDAIVVQLNYRVGLYGFLAAAEVEKDGSINNGLKDQRKALEWVQKYITSFGGDPSRVTLGGASAGGQSVCLQVTAYGGRDDGLFHASAAESQSFPDLRTVAESQYAYNNIVIRTGCMDSNDTLTCLRKLTATQLQAQNFNTPYPGAQNAALYMYGPTLDYDLVSDYTLNAFAQGKFVKVPAIYGDDTDEGTLFAPKSTSSYSQSSTFIQSQFPALTPLQLGTINSLFPVADQQQQQPCCSNTTGPFFRQAADAYGSLRYICPGIRLSALLTTFSIPSYNYRWNVIDPVSAAENLGVTHTIEVQAIFGPDYTRGDAPASYYSPGGVNADIVPVVQAYWTSFIRTRDPNAKRRLGSPRWEEFGREELDGKRLMFQTNRTQMELVPERQQRQCKYLTSIDDSIQL